MKLKFYFLFAMAIAFISTSNAQVEKVLDPMAGFLDDMITADTAADGTRIETTYILKRNSVYYVQGRFENQGWKLILKAEDGSGTRPRIKPYAQEDGSIYSDMILLYGDAEFENIFFDGEGIDPETRPTLRMIRSSFIGLKLDITGCAIANAAQAGIMVSRPADYVKVENCQFFNMGRFAFNDFGNGRVFDCRDSEINLFSLKNSSFANCVDRIIRHRGGSGVMDTVIMDHCTIINNASYHGFIELGNIGNKIQISNNLMVDCMGLGNDSTDLVRLSELNAHGEVDGLENPRMVWIGSIPNDSTMFEIHDNIYKVTSKQQDFYTRNNIDEGPKWILTEHIKEKLGNNAANAWLKKDFTLANKPADMTNFYDFYWDPNGANKQKITTTLLDYDVKDFDYWENTFDCKYTADDVAFIGSDNIPVGDPNWGSIVTADPAPDNVVAWWKFDGDATDYLGTSDGTLMNGGNTAYVDGLLGKAIDFAGSESAHIIVPHNDIIDFDSTESFSVSLLVKGEDMSGTWFFVKGASSNKAPEDHPTWDGKRYEMYFSGTTLRWVVDDDVTKSQCQFENANLKLYPDGWNHIVGVRDRSNSMLYIYINGEKVQEYNDQTKLDISNSSPMIIGNSEPLTKTLSGAMDDARIYDEALSATDIAALTEEYGIKAITTAIDDIHSSSDLKIYPNPFSGQTTLQFNMKNSTDVNISILDITGKTVRSIDAGNFAAGLNTFVIQRENMKPGIYFIKLDAGVNSGCSKIILR